MAFWDEPMDIGDELTEYQLDSIQAELSPGEILCWVGQEPRLRYLLPRILQITLLCILTVLAGFFFGMMMLLNPRFLEMSFINMLPVLALLALAISGILLLFISIFRPGKRAPDIYALTTRQAMVISPGRVAKTWKYDPQAFGLVKIKRHKNGCGDIIFERRFQWSADAMGRTMRKQNLIGFYGVENVGEVYQQLYKLVQPDPGMDKEL
jgi:hypothetical protein